MSDVSLASQLGQSSSELHESASPPTQKKPTSGLAKAGKVLAAVGSLVSVMLLILAIGHAREASRRNGCLSNIRQLALATF